MSIDAKLTVEIEGGVAGSIVNNLDTVVEGFALDARQGYELDQKKLEKNIGAVNAESVLYVSHDGNVVPLHLDAEVIDADGKPTIKLKNGLSAYEIAIANGFEGTEQEWVKSLKGYTPIKGKDYFDGQPGKDGLSPTVTASKSGNVTTITIKDASGTKTATVNDGVDGKNPVKGVDYFDGNDGISPNVIVETIDGGHRVTITDKYGTHIFDVMDGKGDEGGISTIVQRVTYAQLKQYMQDSSLIPGVYYRITDYVTVTAQEGTQSAGHPFDIIVRAFDERTLDEEANASWCDGDEYFANSALGCWKLWYTPDNDVSRFAWADEVNGKGVIYRLIDENGNDCPYDFKNIQLQDALNTADEQYYYTFDTNGADLSLDGSQCFDNVIKKYVDGKQRLNRIIFIARHYKNVTNNFFDVLCYNNTLDGENKNLRFERECYGNKFGYGCTTCNFETKFRNNVVGEEVQSINVGKGASNNVFSSNIYYSTFGTYFRNNVVCKYVYYSSFGHYVQNCILGENAETPGQYMRFLTFENNVQYVNLYKTNTTTKTYMENIRICSGTVGSSSKRIMIEVEELAQKYAITYGNNSNGELVKYCDADSSYSLLPKG